MKVEQEAKIDNGNQMLDTMYKLPDMKNLVKCIINKDVVNEGKEPIFVMKTDMAKLSA